MHSSQTDSQASESSWRTLNFAAFRRKVPLYLRDDTRPTYELAYAEEIRSDQVKLFVVNEMSEMPTPCTVKRDPKADGAWRIQMCSL